MSLLIALPLIVPIVWFVFPFMIRRAAESRLERLCRSRRAIVLSYDDGPSAVLTPHLLGMLRSRRVAATFFVLGQKVGANREVVVRAMAEGHEIGSHSFSHSNAWKVGPVRAAKDLAAGVHAVRELGAGSSLFRPPYGKLTLATLIDCAVRRQRLGWWTIDTKDTKNSEERRRFEDVLETINICGGGVVLMHDFDKETSPMDGISHTEYVTELTGRIIEFAEKNGYRFMRLGDVLRGA